jgi:penicillin amidase
MDPGRAEPLLFTAWLRRFNRALYSDELGKAFSGYWGLRPVFVRRVLGKWRHWCDDVGTQETETCAGLLSATLAQTVAALREEYGDDPAAWRWGDVHKAEFGHPMFRWIPLLRSLTAIELESGGSDHTISRGTSRINHPSEPYAHIHGAGFRAVYDLSDLTRSRFVIATGQSGNLLSPFFGNLVERWRQGGSVGPGGTRQELRARAFGVLVLAPR